jgi:DNA polymerase-3 subunit beta
MTKNSKPLVIVNKKTLLEALKKLEKVVPKANELKTMPILHGVRLMTLGKKLWINACDMETFKSLVIDVKECLNIAVAIMPLKIALKALKALKSEDVTIGITEDQVHITGGNSTYNIARLPTNDYPAVPIRTDEFTVETGTIPSIHLHDALTRMLPAISKEEGRVNLSGVHVCEHGLIATDGHRLHMVELYKDGEHKPMFETPVTIPEKAARVLINDLSKKDVAVELSRDKKIVKKQDGESLEWTNTIHFQIEGETISVKTIEDTFPNYKQVIPENNVYCNTVNAAELRECLEQAALMMTGKYKAIKMTFGAELSLTTSDSEHGSYNGALRIIGKTHKHRIHIGLNTTYLLDYIKGLPKNTTVKFTLKDEQTQCLLSSYEAPGYECVVMPMRL